MRRSETSLVELALLVFAVLTVWSAFGCARFGDVAEDARASWRGARHYAAGTSALDRGETALALEELEAAARLVPDASEVRNHLGLAWWQAGDRVRARAAFETALELDCDNDAARTNLSRLDTFEADAETGAGGGRDER